MVHSFPLLEVIEVGALLLVEARVCNLTGLAVDGVLDGVGLWLLCWVAEDGLSRLCLALRRWTLD